MRNDIFDDGKRWVEEKVGEGDGFIAGNRGGRNGGGAIRV